MTGSTRTGNRAGGLHGVVNFILVKASPYCVVVLTWPHTVMLLPHVPWSMALMKNSLVLGMSATWPRLGRAGYQLAV